MATSLQVNRCVLMFPFVCRQEPGRRRSAGALHFDGGTGCRHESARCASLVLTLRNKARPAWPRLGLSADIRPFFHVDEDDITDWL